MPFRVEFLGTGDAAGLPVWGCDCRACSAARKGTAPTRGPCSALVEAGSARLLLDAGLPDLAERFAPGQLAAILLTHFHADHVLGLARLRWGVGPPLDVHCPPDAEGYGDLLSHPGLLRFHPAQPLRPLTLAGCAVLPLPLAHSRPTLGWLIEHGGRRIAYLTDTAGIPAETAQAARDAALAVVDCSLPPGTAGSGDHNDLDRALDIHRTCRFGRTLLTHVGHRMQAWLDGNALPPGVDAAQDGMAIHV